MATIEFCEKQLTTPLASVSSRMTFSHAPCPLTDTSSTEFNFPYEHEESAEREELKLLGEGLEPDIRTDPLERSELAYLLES